MGYGLKNPDETGVIPGYHETTAQEALDGFLETANYQIQLENFETYISGPGVWLSVLHSDGLTQELAADINELMGSISCSAVAILDQGHLEWRIDIDEVDDHLSKLEVAMVTEALEVTSGTFTGINPRKKLNQWRQVMLAINAYMFAYLVNDGVLDNLRRCQRPECQKFFIGGPRAKWCSENCGGIVRTKNKRKRDRQNDRGLGEHHLST
jgi:hypothetical protein